MAAEFVKQAVSNKVYETEFLELIRDLIKAIDKGVEGVTKDSISLFNFAIQGLGADKYG